jgi:6-phosphogluconate dehydrogenase
MEHLMQIGAIGRGRMGGNIVRWRARAGHSCVVYDANAATVQELGRESFGGHLELDAKQV